MAGERDLRHLLEVILDTGKSPEEVCQGDAELLAQLRARLRRVRQLEAQLDVLLPSSSSPGAGTPSSGLSTARPPQLSGYEVREELGRGGMGVVYRAWDQRLCRPVAVKMLLAGEFARPDERGRFRREAAAAAGLRHVNIVQVYDVGELDGRPYFTMELVEGGSLAEKLVSAPLPARGAAALLATLAEAVQAAHDRGIVHRDLKPGNVLLTTDGTPKIADFGLARLVDDGGALTRTGIPLGTPNYMAPEQALGLTRAIGPAADVYALGAILYETLTGWPPFRANTTAETLRQVVEQPPTPPSHWNAKVPRDLEVICLKCLRKEPHRRYPSAAALADDLRRFERGEAITARPTGVLERSARWLARRRVQVAAFSVGTLLGVALVAAGLWLNSAHEAGTRRERDLARRERDLARRDQSLAAQLDAIRLARATILGGRFDPAADRRFNYARADREYESAFREAGAGAMGDDPADVARRVAASSVRQPLLVALCDWAVCAGLEIRRAWALDVARRVDPEPWRDRARDPAAWANRTALAAMARTAPVSAQPPPFLVALGERLHDMGGDGIDLLARVHQAHPDDFWAALTLARASYERADRTATDAAYRRALELRGNSATVYNNLGVVACSMSRWDEAADDCRKSLEIDTNFAPAHHNLGLALKGQGKWPEAVQQFQEAIRLGPELAPPHYHLGEIRAYVGGLDEAIAEYRHALRIDPEFARAEYMLGVALAGRGWLDEAHDRDHRAVRDDPVRARAQKKTRDIAVGQGISHYKRALRIDPGLNLCGNNVGLTPGDADRLKEAIGHYETAIRFDPWILIAHAARGQALLALGRFREAEAVTRRCLNRMHDGHEWRSNVVALLGRCEQLIALEHRLPAVLTGKEEPAGASEMVEFAELCGILGQPAAAARLYAKAFDASSPPAQDVRSDHRYRAACAAAQAGRARGADGAGLSQEERARWRKRAREWLGAEVDLWTRVLDNGPPADRVLVAQKLARLWADPDLAGLLDQEALDRLPPAERQECRALRNAIDVQISRTQTIK
ncbi:MAG: protein kinase domain-containing protein [Isosphaeraceae bacterium]